MGQSRHMNNEQNDKEPLNEKYNMEAVKIQSKVQADDVVVMIRVKVCEE